MVQSAIDEINTSKSNDNNDEIKLKDLAQYVKDLYVSGAKLWTIDMFRDLEAALATEPKPSIVMLRSMNGMLRSTGVPTPVGRADNQCTQLTIIFHIFQNVVHNASEMSEYIDSSLTTDDKKTFVSSAIGLGLTNQIHSWNSSIADIKLKTAWDDAHHNWTQSVACSKLVAILRSEGFSIAKNITKVICFGLGSLEGSPKRCTLSDLAQDGLPSYRSITQHIAALTIASELGSRLGVRPLQVFVQDPAYSSQAQKLLTSEGFQVLQGYGSLAFTFVDEGTVVFSIHPNIPVKQIVADIARPAIMIWNKVKERVEEPAKHKTMILDGEEVVYSPWTTDEDSDRTRKMVEHYSKYDFPPEPSRFGELNIYVRKGDRVTVSV